MSVVGKMVWACTEFIVSPNNLAALKIVSRHKPQCKPVLRSHEQRTGFVATEAAEIAGDNYTIDCGL